MEAPVDVFAIERPHPSLWRLYWIRALCTGPFALVLLPYFWFRYHTLRYRFDAEGVSMRWGILFRREVNLTYRRIQDIHVVSGIVQRWLGLADIHVQTASGSATAEMTIEGLREYQQVRDFLYGRMRGTGEGGGGAAAGPPAGAPAGADEAVLAEILAELRGARQALERLAGR
jgi:membrane protein YdbS with pleckstrin-like domain